MVPVQSTRPRAPARPLVRATAQQPARPAMARPSSPAARTPMAGPPGPRPAGRPQKSGHPKKANFSKIAINRSREGLGCEPTGPYSEKSTLQGSVYLVIVVQEGAEVVFAETGGRNFENFAVRLAGWPKPAETGWLAGQNRPKTGRKPAETGRSRPGYTVKLPINRPWRPTSMSRHGH